MPEGYNASEARCRYFLQGPSVSHLIPEMVLAKPTPLHSQQNAPANLSVCFQSYLPFSFSVTISLIRASIKWRNTLRVSPVHAGLEAICHVVHIRIACPLRNSLESSSCIFLTRTLQTGDLNTISIACTATGCYRSQMSFDAWVCGHPFAHDSWRLWKKTSNRWHRNSRLQGVR